MTSPTATAASNKRIEGVLGDRTCIGAVYQAFEGKLQFEPPSDEHATVTASLVVPNKVGTQIDHALGELILTSVTEGVFRAVRGPQPAF